MEQKQNDNCSQIENLVGAVKVGIELPKGHAVYVDTRVAIIMAVEDELNQIVNAIYQENAKSQLNHVD